MLSNPVVDVSMNQAVSNWARFNAAIAGAYIRVRRSNGKRDTMFEVFHNGITKPRAPYIFLRHPSIEAFSTQLRQFWSWCGDMPWEWGPVLDAEYAGLTGRQMRDAVSACRDVTQRPVTYGYVGYANLKPGGSATPSTWVTDANVRIIGARYWANDFENAFEHLGLDHPQLDMVQYWNKATVDGLAPGMVIDVNKARRIIMAGAVNVEEDDVVSSADIDKIADRVWSKMIGDVNSTVPYARVIPGDALHNIWAAMFQPGSVMSKMMDLIGKGSGVTAEEIAEASVPMFMAQIKPVIEEAVADVEKAGAQLNAQSILDALGTRLTQNGGTP